MLKLTATNGNTTLSLSYTALTTKLNAVLTDCAEYLFNHGYGDHGTREKPILFTDLTNQQKLNFIDSYIKRTILDCANTNKSVKAQDIARMTEEASKHSL